MLIAKVGWVDKTRLADISVRTLHACSYAMPCPVSSIFDNVLNCVIGEVFSVNCVL